MITEVTDLPDSEQNEENSCFNIITPDRTYEIKGIDKDEKLRYGRVVPPHLCFVFACLFFSLYRRNFLSMQSIFLQRSSFYLGGYPFTDRRRISGVP